MVIVHDNAHRMPSVNHHFGFRAVDPLALSINEQERRDAVLQGARTQGVVIAWRAHTYGQACTLHRSRYNFETDRNLDVLASEGLVDCKRKAIIVLIRADVFDCVSVKGGSITHDCPAAQITLTGSVELEIGGRLSNTAPRNLYKSCGRLGCRDMSVGKCGGYKHTHPV